VGGDLRCSPHPYLPPRGGKVTHRIANRSSAIDMPGPLLTDVSWERSTACSAQGKISHHVRGRFHQARTACQDVAGPLRIRASAVDGINVIGITP
jgi:hypothetical protein